MRRKPTISVATGFSMNRCLPFSTAYSTCSGRKCGEVRKQYDVNFIDDFLVSIEAGEAALFRDVDLAAEVGLTVQRVQAVLEHVREGIAHRDQLDVGVGAQSVRSRAGATTATADQADSQGFVCAGWAMPAKRLSGLAVAPEASSAPPVKTEPVRRNERRLAPEGVFDEV